MVTSLFDRSKVIVQPMKDGDGKRTFELRPIVTMSCHPWDSNTKVSFDFRSRNHTDFFPLRIEQNPLNPPQQDSPVPHMPCEQTPRQPTPGRSSTQWSEDLSCEPSQHNEPPIPGLRMFQLVSQKLRWLRCNPQRNLLVSHHFYFFTPINFSSPLLQPSPACPATPCFIIIINNMPIGSPLPSAKLPSFPQ
ncbi:hypothetical protein O181_111502 [Austropuccinia psidii MF-1]|uniref:Uncharacterized protein n=1 Tax=Austropuccinia psidii MF-1 TaxID=1389203 RepID=A0A9Q3K1X1_9BASI|nr:hypothetical protein [Austropuccinia psidii MF-1]